MVERHKGNLKPELVGTVETRSRGAFTAASGKRSKLWVTHFPFLEAGELHDQADYGGFGESVPFEGSLSAVGPAKVDSFSRGIKRHSLGEAGSLSVFSFPGPFTHRHGLTPSPNSMAAGFRLKTAKNHLPREGA
jgi:hypothetical protein